jgi:hypothetical protein
MRASSRIDHHAVGQHVDRQVAHVVRDAVVAAVYQRARLGGAAQRNRAARGHAGFQLFALAGLADQVQQVGRQAVLELDLSGRLTQGDHVLARHDRFEPGQLRGRRVVAQDGGFFGRVRVADVQSHQEAVELRLGQRVGAVVLERVLRCDHEERTGQGVRNSVDGDRGLAHRFEQRGLGLRARAVDLVGQNHVGEQRAGLKGEVGAGPAVDHLRGGDAQDVAGQQVAGELDTLEAGVDGAGQRVGQRGLAHARHVFQQQMAAGDQRFHGASHYLGLASERALHVAAQGPGGLRGLCGSEGVRHGPSSVRNASGLRGNPHDFKGMRPPPHPRLEVVAHACTGRKPACGGGS